MGLSLLINRLKLSITGLPKFTPKFVPECYAHYRMDFLLPYRPERRTKKKEKDIREKLWLS